MKECLDTILETLNMPFLTTAEWAVASGVLDGRDNLPAKYQALYAVLEKRGASAVEFQTLLGYFEGQGMSKEQAKKVPGFSNIFLGAPLK